MGHGSPPLHSRALLEARCPHARHASRLIPSAASGAAPPSCECDERSPSGELGCATAIRRNWDPLGGDCRAPLPVVCDEPGRIATEVPAIASGTAASGGHRLQAPLSHADHTAWSERYLRSRSAGEAIPFLGGCQSPGESRDGLSDVCPANVPSAPRRSRLTLQANEGWNEHCAGQSPASSAVASSGMTSVSGPWIRNGPDAREPRPA